MSVATILRNKMDFILLQQYNRYLQNLVTYVATLLKSCNITTMVSQFLGVNFLKFQTSHGTKFRSFMHTNIKNKGRLLDH